MKGKMETGFRQIEKYNPARHLCLLLVILALIANGAKLCLAIIYDFVLERIDIVDGKQLILLGISSLVTIIIISAVNWVKRVLGEEHRQKRIAQVQGKVISELVGDFAAFMMLSDYFNWPFTEVGGLLAERTKIKVSLERLEKYLLLEKDDCEMKKSTEGDAIYFTNAELSLENSGKLIIKKNVINMNGKDRIAIVGGSGKGKTTLCKLIMGGYYPSKGEISICLDGKKYSKGMLRSVIGYMPQKSNIFSGTIKENIAVGKEGATEEEIKEVARIACVDSFVKEFPEGYKTVVGNNAKYQLSGGQIARIALARTLLRSVPIYILDEFSAALDNETELKILNNLEEIDAIIIHVTHKEQTKGFCNKIVNIDNFVNLCTGGCRTK